MAVIEEFTRVLSEIYRPRIYDVSVIMTSKEAGELGDRIALWIENSNYSVLFSRDHPKYIEVSVNVVDPWYASDVDIYDLFAKHNAYAKILVVLAEFNRREEAPVLYKILQEYRKRMPNGKVLVILLVPGPGTPMEIRALTYSWITRISNENLVDAIIVVNPRRLADFVGLGLDGEYVYRYSGLGEVIGAIVSGKALFFEEASRWSDSKIWIIASLLGASIPLYNGLEEMLKALELGSLMSPWTWDGDSVVLVVRSEPRVELRYDDLKLIFSEWASKRFKNLVSMTIDYAKASRGSVKRITMVLLERLQPELVDKVLGYLKKAYLEYRRSLLEE